MSSLSLNAARPTHAKISSATGLAEATAVVVLLTDPDTGEESCVGPFPKSTPEAAIRAASAEDGARVVPLYTP